MGDSGAGARARVPSRASGRALQSQSKHIPNTSAQNGIPLRSPANVAPETASGGRTRAWPEECASSCGLCIAGALGYGEICAGLFSICLLKNTQNLRFQFRKFNREHRLMGMEDQVAADRQQLDMTPEYVAQATLDAIPFVRFTDYLADRETDAGAGRLILRRQEPAHRGRAALSSRSSVGALIIRVLAQS